MSYPTETIICPNCGTPAADNYCAHCGQENHLHKETFWGLVMHFIGHYFHYDSKFSQTIKALWFSPGKLTIAYVNKQRMRYIPPISLYIFISAVYFLVSFTFGGERKYATVTEGTKKESKASGVAVPVHGIRNLVDSLDESTVADTAKAEKGSFGAYMNKKHDLITSKHGDANKFMNEQISHTIPKIFFFMIPVMALLLKLLFLRRKTAYFVDHAIFSLHYHSFWFSLFIISLIQMPQVASAILYFILSVIAAIYMVVALRKVYSIGKGRAILYMFTLGFGYVIFLGIAFVIDALLIVAMA